MGQEPTSDRDRSLTRSPAVPTDAVHEHLAAVQTGYAGDVVDGSPEGRRWGTVGVAELGRVWSGSRSVWCGDRGVPGTTRDEESGWFTLKEKDPPSTTGWGVRGEGWGRGPCRTRGAKGP